MIFQTFLVHDLLRKAITSAEQYLLATSDIDYIVELAILLTADVRACVSSGRAATFA